MNIKSFFRKTVFFSQKLLLRKRIKSMSELGYSFDDSGFFERIAFKENGIEIKLYAKKIKNKAVLISASKGGKVNNSPVMTVELYDLIYGSPIQLNECSDVDALKVKIPFFKSFASIIKDIEANCLVVLTELSVDKLFPLMSGTVRDEIINGESKFFKIKWLRS